MSIKPPVRPRSPLAVPVRRALTGVRAATTLAPARPAYAAGLRAALATIAPLAAAHAFQLGGATWMSLAGFSNALADKGGPYRTRAATLATLTVTGALAAILGALAGSRPPLAIPLTFAVAVACSLGRAYGDPGASVGVSVLNIYVISLGYPAGEGDPLGRAAYVVVGGAWAMLVSLVFWPLRPYRPLRLAVASGYRAVAEYADGLAAWTRHGTPPGPVRVRAVLEAAHAALATVRRGRPSESGRGERLLILGETADQLFGQLFGLSDVVESISVEVRSPVAHEALAGTVAAAARSLREVADRIEAEEGSGSVRVGWGGDLLRVALASGDAAGPADDGPPAGAARARASAERAPADNAAAGEASAAYEHAAAVLDRLAQYAGVATAMAAGLNTGTALTALERPREIEDPVPAPSLLAPLRAVLDRDSIVLRFALGAGLVTAAAVALTASMGLRRGYWVTITAVLILQPYTGATSQRALQRVFGTIVGGALTAALAALFHDPLAILGLAFVFSAVSVALLPLNYAAFSVFLTPTFVLLAEASAGDWHLAGVRILNTLLGGALALAGNRLLWPSPEAVRTPAYLAATLRAIRRYVDTVVSCFDHRNAAAGRTLRAARRRVGLAILNADESLQRRMGEHRGPPEDLAPLMTIGTYTRRLTASVAALALTRHSIDAPPQEVLAPFAAVIDAVLDDLADALDQGRPPCDMLDPPTTPTSGLSPLLRGRLVRVERQLRTLHDAVGRWIPPVEG